MKKLRVLFIGDGAAPTGFSTVMHGIIENLPQKIFDVHHLAINYRGDPHDYTWKLYPASLLNTNDFLGLERLKHQFSKIDDGWDGIFILNDLWVINMYLKVIKESFTKIPPIVIYFPVDSTSYDKEWVENFDIVKKVVVYTRFGFDVLSEVYDGDNVSIIPHGINTNIFKKLSDSRETIRLNIFPNTGDFTNAFIVLSANRNQPRKRLDITMKAFSIFAKNKKDVKLYLHCGIKDAGYDIIKLATKLNIQDKLIITSNSRGIQNIPPNKLNVIYNACNVGINSSIGEGWSLTNMEHAVTGAPQVVPNHSALTELYEDCGILVPTKYDFTNIDTLTEGKVVTPEDMATGLEMLYEDKNLYAELSTKSINKFSNEKYSWEYIVKNNWMPIFEDAYEI